MFDHFSSLCMKGFIVAIQNQHFCLMINFKMPKITTSTTLKVTAHLCLTSHDEFSSGYFDHIKFQITMTTLLLLARKSFHVSWSNTMSLSRPLHNTIEKHSCFPQTTRRKSLLLKWTYKKNLIKWPYCYVELNEWRM